VASVLVGQRAQQCFNAHYCCQINCLERLNDRPSEIDIFLNPRFVNAKFFSWDLTISCY